MAFSASTMNLLIGPLGGGPLRVWVYKTDDSLDEVTTPSYFSRLDRLGVRAGDVVAVRGGDGTTEYVAAASQTFIFNSTVSQFIDGALVPSPEGSGWAPGAEFTFSPTIAAGVITIPTQLRVTGLLVSVETQGGASSDDLDTISGSFNGQQITIRRETSGHNVVLKNGTGNLSIGGDITISAVDDFVTLCRRGNTWHLVDSNI
jgi:hypothetical protein